MYTFGIETDSKFPTVWGFMKNISNLPLWDAGTESALSVGHGVWMVKMRPLSEGAPPIVMLGTPVFSETRGTGRVNTVWTYDDGAFAAEDGWCVFEDVERNVCRITYELTRYRLRGWRGSFQWVLACCFVQPALQEYARKDVMLLRRLFSQQGVMKLE